MSLVAESRLRGVRSQQVFDVLLRTLAEPGTVHHLPLAGLPAVVPPELWLLLALADVDETVCVDRPDAAQWAELVRDATGARIVEAADADMVATASPNIDLLATLRVGTALAPEDGARLTIAVDSIHGADADAGAGEVTLVCSGPGVPGERLLGVDGLAPDVALGLGRASGAFPTGFDTWLVARDGAVAAISRSTTIDIKGVG